MLRNLLAIVASLALFGSAVWAEPPKEDGIKLSGAVNMGKSFAMKEIFSIPGHLTRVKVGKLDGSYFGAFEGEGFPISNLIQKGMIKEQTDNGFNRKLDTFISISSRNGQKVVFSYGELFLSTRGCEPIILKTLRFIFPHHHEDLSKMNWSEKAWFDPNQGKLQAEKSGCFNCHKDDSGPILEFPRILCVLSPGDRWPPRFLEDIQEITVHQIPEIPAVATQSQETMWGEKPIVHLPNGGSIEITSEAIEKFPKIEFQDSTFGEGKGFHGNNKWVGISLADFLRPHLGNTELRNLCVLVTSADQYRSTFSGGEIFLDRNPNNALIVYEENGAPLKPGAGKFKIMLTSDFFIDRSVRSVVEIRCFVPE